MHIRYGHQVKYPRDCAALAEEISATCKAKISASTLKRLYGFVKGASQDPRLYTLDLISEYLGYKGWEHLLSDISPEGQPEKSKIERLSSNQIKKEQVVTLLYEPSRLIELKKTENGFLIISSNDRKLQVNDILYFGNLKLHLPVTFENVYRKGIDLGKLQVATVSGLTSIKKG
jgi:hypothetical protein